MKLTNIYEELEEQIFQEGTPLNIIIRKQIPMDLNINNYEVSVGNFIQLRTDHSVLYRVDFESNETDDRLTAYFLVSSDGYIGEPTDEMTDEPVENLVKHSVEQYIENKRRQVKESDEELIEEAKENGCDDVDEFLDLERLDEEGRGSLHEDISRIHTLNRVADELEKLLKEIK